MRNRGWITLGRGITGVRWGGLQLRIGVSGVSGTVTQMHKFLESTRHALRLPWHMSRRSRVVIPGFPHHVTQRGNNRRDVFFSDAERETYLKLLRQYCSEYGVGVLG